VTEASPSRGVADCESVLRHIPAGTHWQGKPGEPRITSPNFELRNTESGVSVTRWSITTASQLLARLKSGAGNMVGEASRVAVAKVKDIQKAGFSVVPKPQEDDPGHAEIQSAGSDLKSHLARKHLASLFRFLDPANFDQLQPE